MMLSESCRAIYIENHFSQNLFCHFRGFLKKVINNLSCNTLMLLFDYLYKKSKYVTSKDLRFNGTL